MTEIPKTYYRELIAFINSIRVTDKNRRVLDFSESIKDVCSLIITMSGSGSKLIFIGNGGSAAISSHMAIDFWKNGGIKAVSFNDGPQLTCLGNDFGYKHVFEKPIEMFANKGDILVAISSSGKSENILLGVQAAQLKGCSVVTLSGFDENNPLSSFGEFNFYVPSKSYGPVEVIHHSICHCIMDTMLKKKNG